MANYYTDHPEIAFYLQHPLMRRIVELREKGFADKDLYPDAPVDYEDCIENYKRLLEVVGDITANIIAPNSESVDLEGPHLENGRMIYASKTVENMEAMRKAGLTGDLEPAELRRHPVRVRLRGAAAEVPPAHLRRRDHVHGPDRARCRFGPPARHAQGDVERGTGMLAPERCEAVHHQRRLRHPPGPRPQRRRNP